MRVLSPLVAMVAACALSDCAPASTNPARTGDTTTFAASVKIDVGTIEREAPAAVAGTNVQWVDGADNLVADYARGGVASVTAGTGSAASAGVKAGPSLASYAPALLRAIDSVRPNALRFPGGTNADTYHWKDGVGALERRGLGEHVFRKEKQRMVFGTDEFLSLAARLNATPLITVNVPTGTAAEAAEWVTYVNRPANAATPPRVKYWEVGNEPYLREELRPELTLQPPAFAARANEYINAMKAADGRIAIGVPLRLDKLGALPLVHFPGYAETVLRTVTAPIDFVSLHNAYLPLLYKGGKGGTNPDVDDLFSVLMAASRVVSEDIANVRTLWKQVRPTQPLAIAVTEYSSMFTLGGGLDANVSSIGGALYLADVLRVFATTPELIMANQWSLNGNGIFGALNTDGTMRPSAVVLQLYAHLYRGNVVKSTVTSPTFDSPAMGVVPEYKGTPLISALTTVDSSGPSKRLQVHIVLLNKSTSRPAQVAVESIVSKNVGPLRVTKAETLAPSLGASVFDAKAATPTWKNARISDSNSLQQVLLPAKSVTHVTLELTSALRR